MVEQLKHLISQAKSEILETFSLLSPFDYLLFVGVFLSFVLLYFISCLSSRFFIPLIFKTLAFSFLVLAPIAINYLGQNLLYAHRVDYTMAKPLEYTPTFLLDATITNVGRREIGQCYFVIEALRNPENRIRSLINKIYPLKTYTIPIKHPIAVGESFKFMKTIEKFAYKCYQTKLFCYGGKGYGSRGSGK